MTDDSPALATLLRFEHGGPDACGPHAGDMKARFEDPGARSHWFAGLPAFIA